MVGVLLGLAMMWLVFDLLGSAPAAVEMKKTFVSTIRLLAEFVREPVPGDRGTAEEHSYALRERINAQFDVVRALADGEMFEFGPMRQQNLVLRAHIRRWSPLLRSLFLMRIASVRYAFQAPGFELPEEVQRWRREYENRSAAILENVAEPD